jgi:hypothetical protein
MDPQIEEEGDTPEWRQRDRDQRLPLAIAIDRDSGSNSARGDQRRSIRPRRGAERSEDPGEQPALPHQREQADADAHDERWLGVGPRHHDGAGEQAEQHHRSLRGFDVEHLTGEQSDEDNRDARQHDVETEHRLVDAARKHVVEPP